jgi:hypothetical protein
MGVLFSKDVQSCTPLTSETEIVSFTTNILTNRVVKKRKKPNRMMPKKAFDIFERPQESLHTIYEQESIEQQEKTIEQMEEHVHMYDKNTFKHIQNVSQSQFYQVNHPSTVESS